MKRENLSRLRIEGLPINERLPAIEPKIFRSAREVAIRVNILSIFVAISDDQKSISFFKDILVEQDMIRHISSSEGNVLRKGILSKQEEIDFSWNRESIYTLCWCLGIIESIGSAKNESSLDLIFEHLPPEVDLIDFIEKAKTIDHQIIMDELIYYYNLHWALRHPENWNWRSKYKLKEYKISLVRERRRALEWIVDNTLDWEEISLDT